MKWSDYFAHAFKVSGGSLLTLPNAEIIWRHLMTATAAQRAEAFLRTIGKWEESQ